MPQPTRIAAQPTTDWDSRGPGRIEDLSRAIELKNDNAGAYTNRGLAHFAVGQYDKAVADLSEAITIAPKNAVPYSTAPKCSGSGYARNRRWKIMTPLSGSTLASPQPTPPALISATKRDNGTVQCTITTWPFDLDPNEVELLYDRGNTQHRAGDWQAALAELRSCRHSRSAEARDLFRRGWSRFCAGVKERRFDARVYLKLKGWREKSVSYMAILAALAVCQAQTALKMPNESLTRPSLTCLLRVWPVAVLRYLRGELTEAALLGFAVSARQQTEAHAFIGLDHLLAGDRAGAIPHLQWARDHGDDGSIAHDVARATLVRLEPANR